MIDRTTKLRWRRRFKQRRRQVEDMGQLAEDQLEQQFFRRLSKLGQVRRFVAGWVLLLVLAAGGLVAQTLALTHYYQHLAPQAGGTYTEGITGAFTNANPIYATGSVDSAVSHLIFAGLFKYDDNNRLTGDLASQWTVNPAGLVYTVKLKPHLHWQDGQPLTSADVVYTFQTIQNADAGSPLQSAWQGIKLSAPDSRTIVFTLPNPLTAFPNSLTVGIIPKHLLSSIPLNELRSASFNTVTPVGAGPFRWDTIQITGDKADQRQDEIGLVANTNYYAGRPKLDRFVVRTFQDENQMLTSFQQHLLNGMAGLDSLPDTLQSKAGVNQYSIPLTAENMVFFRTDSPLLADQKIRQALVQAVNVPTLDKSFGYPVIEADSPLLKGQLGYDKTTTQLPYNLLAANKLLDDDGWVVGKNGIRTKNNQPLTFTLYSQSTSEFASVTQQLQTAWRKIGVNLQVNLQTASDLQITIETHDYDALLYGISIGTDPDVFVYWDSSQADPHLAVRYNFSNYKSSAADAALEAGRNRSDPTLRIIKYKPFLEAWRNDAPALALYQPRFLYVTQGQLFNFNPKVINDPTGRYVDVANWMVREAQTTQ